MKGKSNRRPSKKNRSGRSRPRSLSGHLPMIRNPTLHTNSFRLRYLLTGSSTITVSPFQLINSMFVTNQSGSVVRSVVDSIRLHFVEVWLSSVQGGSSAGSYTPQTLNVGFLPNQNFGDQRFVSDTSMSTDPAHVKLISRRKETSGMWQSAASNQQWTISFGTLLPNSVVDFMLDVRFNNSVAATTENTNISVTTEPPIGSLAFINLVNGSNVQTAQWIPQGLLYTT